MDLLSSSANVSDWHPALRQALRARVSNEDWRTWFEPFPPARQGTSLVVNVPSERLRLAFEEGFLGELAAAMREVGEDGTPRVVAAPCEPRTLVEGALQPGMDFGQFVAGASNSFALQAAQAVAAAPGQRHQFNPLFLFGPAGVGKTHLLHAMGHAYASRAGSVISVTAEKFVNDFVEATKANRMEEFRSRYRTAGLLLVDDVQFLAGKERSQEEFFYTFDTLYQLGQQLVLTADAAPFALDSLAERLRSRFGWGLVANLGLPDRDLCRRIVLTKASARGLFMSPEIADWIAGDVTSVRELEGRLNQVQARAALCEVALSIELAEQVLPRVPPPAPTPADVITAVAKRYGFRKEELCRASQQQSWAMPRMVAMYLCRHVLKLSLEQIGHQFRDRHRSTVAYSIAKIASQVESDPLLKRVLSELELQVLETREFRGVSSTIGAPYARS
jgi:chromosomal replication initiator protein